MKEPTRFQGTRSAPIRPERQKQAEERLLLFALRQPSPQREIPPGTMARCHVAAPSSKSYLSPRRSSRRLPMQFGRERRSRSLFGRCAKSCSRVSPFEDAGDRDELPALATSDAKTSYNTRTIVAGHTSSLAGESITSRPECGWSRLALVNALLARSALRAAPFPRRPRPFSRI